MSCSQLLVDIQAQSNTAVRRDAIRTTLLLGPARGYAPEAAGWLFKGPLPVRLEPEEDGTVVAVEQLFGNYGQGANAHEALRDLTIVLMGYHRLLSNAEDPETREVFQELETYFKPAKP